MTSGADCFLLVGIKVRRSTIAELSTGASFWYWKLPPASKMGGKSLLPLRHFSSFPTPLFPCLNFYGLYFSSVGRTAAPTLWNIFMQGSLALHVFSYRVHFFHFVLQKQAADPASKRDGSQCLLTWLERGKQLIWTCSFRWSFYRSLWEDNKLLADIKNLKNATGMLV